MAKSENAGLLLHRRSSGYSVPKANEKKILAAVRSGAITVQEVGAATGISRITLYKYLAVLEVRGAVASRRVGSTRIYIARTARKVKEGRAWIKI